MSWDRKETLPRLLTTFILVLLRWESDHGKVQVRWMVRFLALERELIDCLVPPMRTPSHKDWELLKRSFVALAESMAGWPQIPKKKQADRGALQAGEEITQSIGQTNKRAVQAVQDEEALEERMVQA